MLAISPSIKRKHFGVQAVDDVAIQVQDSKISYSSGGRKIF